MLLCFSSTSAGNPADRVLHVTSTSLQSFMCHHAQLYGLLCSFSCKIKSNLSLAPGRILPLRERSYRTAAFYKFGGVAEPCCQAASNVQFAADKHEKQYLFS